MPMITGLTLNSFRSYEVLDLSGLDASFVVLTGPNGAGKTNILEAISLLAHPRGLRGCPLLEAQRHGSADPLAISARVSDPYGTQQIGVGLAPNLNTKILRLNGEDQRGHNAFHDILRCVWLTPQMDGLFLQSGSDRRRFFDRLVASFDPAHQGRITRYDKAMGERSKLLKDNATPDPSWLDALETQMAETAMALAASRIDHLHRLRDQGRDVIPADSPFPRAEITLTGIAETALEAGEAALDIEDSLRALYQASRMRDSITGGAQDGAHKCDMQVTHAEKNLVAAQCSTGEQKALLTGIVLANAVILHHLHAQAPILLFDEVAAHLDNHRRSALFDTLSGLSTQIWMTGTEEGVFEGVPDSAISISVTPGKAVIQQS